MTTKTVFVRFDHWWATLNTYLPGWPWDDNIGGGPRSILQTDFATRIVDVTDGVSNSVLAVECAVLVEELDRNAIRRLDEGHAAIAWRPITVWP